MNAIELEALGENVTNRGVRTDEQIALLCTLWCEKSVSFDGTCHHLTGAGIAPLPR